MHARRLVTHPSRTRVIVAALCAGMLVLATAEPAAPSPLCEVLEDRSYTPRILQLLASATRSIQVMMFEATSYGRHRNSPSNRIIQALIDAVGRGVDVEVILDRAGQSRRNSDSNMITARRLREGRVTVYLDPVSVTTHAKLLVVDERYTVCGSTNWTYSALSRNHEVSLLLDDLDVARRIGRYFARVKSQCSTKF